MLKLRGYGQMLTHFRIVRLIQSLLFWWPHWNCTLSPEMMRMITFWSLRFETVLLTEFYKKSNNCNILGESSTLQYCLSMKNRRKTSIKKLYLYFHQDKSNVEVHHVVLPPPILLFNTLSFLADSISFDVDVSEVNSQGLRGQNSQMCSK